MGYTESILDSIKKLLGPSVDYNQFDQDIITHINTALMDLNRIGIGPPEGFSIKDSSSVWKDFINDLTKFEGIKTYVYLSVKLVFDPPSNSSVLASMEKRLDKLEWTLNSTVNTAEV